MSENKRTPEQILEEANAFFEKAGVTVALEEFLNSDSVKTTVEQQSQLFAECFKDDFPFFFRMIIFMGCIETTERYGYEEESTYRRLAEAFSNKTEFWNRMVKTICELQRNSYKLALEYLGKQSVGEEEVSEPQPVNAENCGETKCRYGEDCRQLGFCPKGKEFLCNGKGKASGECNCPCADLCNPGEGRFPCEELDFTVIPPEGGCGECGVD